MIKKRAKENYKEKIAIWYSIDISPSGQYAVQPYIRIHKSQLGRGTRASYLVIKESEDIHENDSSSDQSKPDTYTDRLIEKLGL